MWLRAILPGSLLLLSPQLVAADIPAQRHLAITPPFSGPACDAAMAFLQERGRTDDQPLEVAGAPDDASPSLEELEHFLRNTPTVGHEIEVEALRLQVAWKAFNPFTVCENLRAWLASGEVRSSAKPVDPAGWHSSLDSKAGVNRLVIFMPVEVSDGSVFIGYAAACGLLCGNNGIAVMRRNKDGRWRIADDRMTAVS